MYDEYLELAKIAAMKAGEFLRERQNMRIDESLVHDIKLSSDKESEKIIIDCLSKSSLPILSEECGQIGGFEKSGGMRWIVDPLDGTINYFKRINELCCVSIALFNGDMPVLGVINRYACGELFCGVAGQGALLNGKCIKSSNVEHMNEAVIATGFPAGRNYSDDSLLTFVKRVQRVKKVRMLGTAAIMAAFVSCGRVDAYFEEDIRLWDIAAAMVVVKAAGGSVNLRVKEDYKCDFGAFSTKKLMEVFYDS